MKVIKSMKKLKFWSRKKRKNNSLLMESPPPPSRPPPPPARPPPPPPYYTVHHHYEPVQPSAPPLPPWLEYGHQFQEMHLKSNEANSSSSASVYDSISRSPEINSPEIRCTEFQAETSSYQQYMVQDPVYDTTIVPELVKLEKNDGALGRVIGLGVHLVQCVFPCFHIREVIR